MREINSAFNFGTDYTLEDFEKESLDRRLEILTTAVSSIPVSILHLSLQYGKVYKSGKKLLEDLLDYLNIPPEKFMKEKKSYRIYIPTSPKTYWNYISINKSEEGIMARINLVTKVKITPKTGYTLTSFGEALKPFVAYILKKYAEYEINPEELFRKYPVDSIKILENICKEENIAISKMKKIINMYSSLSKDFYLKKFERLGLIKYNRGPTHAINKEKIEEILQCLDNEECKKEITSTYRYIPYRMTRRVLEYLKNEDVKIIRTRELARVLNINYDSSHSLRNIIKFLKDNGVLSLSSVYKITEKGKGVCKDIIEPILEVAENPDNITKYNAELNEKDKLKILEINAYYKIYKNR